MVNPGKTRGKMNWGRKETRERTGKEPLDATRRGNQRLRTTRRTRIIGTSETATKRKN